MDIVITPQARCTTDPPSTEFGVRVQPFVLVAHARSGSSLLMDALGQHPHILNCDELFGDTEEERPDLPLSFQRFNPSSPIRYRNSQSGRDFLHHIFYEAAHPLPLRAVGCKILHNQCLFSPSARTVWTFLRSRRDIRIIRLFRRNLLAAWVSLETAFQTQQWHLAPDLESHEREKRIEVPPQSVSIPKFEGYAREVLSFQHRSDRRFRNHATISIEYHADLCRAFDPSMQRIYGFLGLDNYPPRMRTAKQRRRPLRDQVTNYDEIVHHFRDTPLLPHVLVPPSDEE
jgi:hypothetical protein